MKRIIGIFLSLFMLLCLTACREDDEQPQKSESNEISDIQSSADSSEEQNINHSDKPEFLTLEKSLFTYYEWVDDYEKVLVRSEHSHVTLGQEDACLYPETATVLNQIATMQENTMLDEFDNLVTIAREELDGNRNGFETYVSTLDVQVRRADSLVISLLSDSYSDYGRIEKYRVLHGSNYDTRSGRKLALNDVIKSVNNDLAEVVEKELTGHMWTGDFRYEYVVQDYFANTPYDGFSWTLDYNGVTFYFSPGEFCDGGAMTATVSFAEHPELFYEKYMAVPTEYAVEIPLNSSFFTNLDTDGSLEEISLFCKNDDERDAYSEYGVCTDNDAQNYSEECYVYDFHPYYVKADSGNYLYLFCEDFDEGVRQMRLVVLTLNDDGSVTKCGERNISPSFLADNKFIIPSDPERLVFDDHDNGTEKNEFTVGDNGMPIK